MHNRILITLGLAAFFGCGSDQAAPVAAPRSEPAATAPRADHSAIDIQMGSNTIVPSGGASADPFSVIAVEVTAPSPFKLTVRVQPELAPDLANEMLQTVGSAKGKRSFAIKEMDGPKLGASLKIENTTFTIAGRPIEIAGGRLHVCGVDLGPLASGAVVTLQQGEVRVDDAVRGPLPAPVEAR